MKKQFIRKFAVRNQSLFKLKTVMIFMGLLFSTFAHAQTYVTSGSNLSSLVNAASAGEVFIVPNGTYNNFSATFTAIANADNPIIVKAETIGGVILTGDSKFVFNKAAHIVLEGFNFNCTGNNSLVKLNGSNHIRITRNEFKLITSNSVKWVYIGGFWNDYTFDFLSHHNRIDHNIFKDKNTPGNYITIDGTSNEAETVLLQSQYDRIDHNYFKNNSPRAANEQESIRVGWSAMSMSSGFTIIEKNLFEDCDGDPEVVSVKSCDNIIRNNTFFESYGTLSLRHGNRNRVEGNYFFGGNKANGSFGTSTIYTGGIRIYGKDHLIINNYFEGLKGTRWDAPITLTQGDAIDGNSSDLTKHFRAENVIIAYNTLVNNTYGIEIGFDNNNNYNTSLSNIKIVNNLVIGNTNSLVNYVEGNTQGSQITWFNNVMYPTGSATLTSNGSSFSSSQVTVANPNLVYDGTVFRATNSTTTIGSGIADLMVLQDIDGQSRPTISNVGADHFSSEPETNAPMTALTVGTFAFEDDEVPSEVLFASSVGIFSGEGATTQSTITSNLDWTAASNQDWIEINTTSGSNNGTLQITVLPNPGCEARSGTILFTGGNLSISLMINQEAGDPTVQLNLINSGTSIDPVTVTASTAQDGNPAINSLDKDFDTRWSGEGIGAYVVYDLGNIYNLDLIRIATISGKIYYYEILTSLDGLNYDSVSEVQSNNLGTFSCFPVSNQAKFVKIIGNGQSNGSVWNSITEIEIFGTDSSLSQDSFNSSSLVLFPNPVMDMLQISNKNVPFSKIDFYSIDGKLLFTKSFNAPLSAYELDLSVFKNGTYLIKIEGINRISAIQKIVINH